MCLTEISTPRAGAAVKVRTFSETLYAFVTPGVDGY